MLEAFFFGRFALKITSPLYNTPFPGFCRTKPFTRRMLLFFLSLLVSSFLLESRVFFFLRLASQDHALPVVTVVMPRRQAARIGWQFRGQKHRDEGAFDCARVFLPTIATTMMTMMTKGPFASAAGL